MCLQAGMLKDVQNIFSGFIRFVLRKKVNKNISFVCTFGYGNKSADYVYDLKLISKI